MLTKKLIPDVCLSSSSLRCIQTCERVLTGAILSSPFLRHISLRIHYSRHGSS